MAKITEKGIPTNIPGICPSKRSMARVSWLNLTSLKPFLSDLKGKKLILNIFPES